jgi:DNA-binding MarR family transcriptional regulator
MPAQGVPYRDAAPAAGEAVASQTQADQLRADEMTIAAIESALHSLARRLKQARLHEYIARQAGDGCDQAGLAILYVLHSEYTPRGEETSLRITDVAARLSIDAPAVTRKAQQLERLGLVSRARDAGDARAWRLRLTPEGHRVLSQFLLARHQWLATLLADWPAADCREFARLISRFADDVSRHLTELDC